MNPFLELRYFVSDTDEDLCLLPFSDVVLFVHACYEGLDGGSGIHYSLKI